MKLPTIKVRDKESTTAFLVAISWLIVTFKYAVAGATLGPLGRMPEIGASEYGTAIGIILAIWLGLEWTEKSKP